MKSNKDIGNYDRKQQAPASVNVTTVELLHTGATGSSTSIDKTYRTLVRQRQDEEIKNKRKVVEMNAAEDIKRRCIQPANVVSTDNSIVKPSKSAVAGNQSDRRERMDRADLLKYVN